MGLHGLTAGLIAAASLYAVVVLAVYLGQARLLYLPDLPSRALHATPENIGLAYRDVWLDGGDGVRLHAWVVPHPAPRGHLLFLHGNAGNISHRLDSLRIFHDLGLTVLIFDYRGYGQSTGVPDETGTRHDASAAWRYLTEMLGVPAERIVLFGRSLGGSLAAWLATQQRPAAVILESTFTSVPDLAAELYPWLPAHRLSRFRYDTRTAVAATTCPVLVVHSREDEIIPYTHGAALYATAHPPKTLLEISGPHNTGFLIDRERYVAGLRAFLYRHLPQPPG